ncbi:MAG: hypothetical protein ACM31C_15605 [Acidobacteriota bacterium]
MRFVLVLVLVLVSCKSHSSAPIPPKRDAAAVEVDWARCEKAIASLASIDSDAARIEALLDGCQVCGDWTPILQWSTPQSQGGPSHKAIEERMDTCNAWCTGTAKLQFLGTLDNARGTSSRAPWRVLGDLCKDKVSAVPDPRYMSAPYFALDRIARAVAAHGGPAADQLASFWFALPPLAVNGTAIEAPSWASEVDGVPNNVEVVSVLGDQLYLGRLPRAHLTARGVELVEPDSYPGKPIRADELAKHDGPLALYAPAQMPAKQLAARLAPAKGVALELVVALKTKLASWPMIGAYPAGLDLTKATDSNTVQDLVSAIPPGVRIRVKP